MGVLVVDDGSPDGTGDIADEALETHDLVIGSRYVQGVSVQNWPLRRILLSAFANRYIRGITGLRAHDCTSGYRCWRRTALARLPLHSLRSEGYAFLVELLFQAHANGCHIGEVPIIFIERRAGASKISRHVLLESIATPWRLRVQHTARRIGSTFRRADDVARANGARVTTGTVNDAGS